MQAFFSLKDTWTPLWAAIAAVLVNLVAGLLLMGPMAHGGLALATSLAAAFNVLLLFAILVGRLGGFPTREFAVSLAKIGLASALMGIYLVWVRHLGDWSLGLHARNGLILCACIGGWLVVFSVAAYLLRCPELRSIINIVRTKLTRA